MDDSTVEFTFINVLEIFFYQNNYLLNIIIKMVFVDMNNNNNLREREREYKPI